MGAICSEREEILGGEKVAPSIEEKKEEGAITVTPLRKKN